MEQKTKVKEQPPLKSTILIKNVLIIQYASDFKIGMWRSYSCLMEKLNQWYYVNEMNLWSTSYLMKASVP